MQTQSKEHTLPKSVTRTQGHLNYKRIARSGLSGFLWGFAKTMDVSGSIGSQKIARIRKRAHSHNMEKAWKMTGDAMYQAMKQVDMHGKR